MTDSSRPSSLPVGTGPHMRVIAVSAPAGATTHLVVLLHGLGDSAAGIQDIARTLSPGLRHADWLVPDGFHPFDGGGDGHQWFSIRGVTDANRAERVREAATEVSPWSDKVIVADLGGQPSRARRKAPSLVIG